mgnify:FL=1
MGTITLMNDALVSRGLLPVDGHCTCTHCDKYGLDRDDIHIINRADRVCETCRPLYMDDRQPACTCGHDQINPSGQVGFVECYNCAQRPREIDARFEHDQREKMHRANFEKDCI